MSWPGIYETIVMHFLYLFLFLINNTEMNTLLERFHFVQYWRRNYLLCPYIIYHCYSDHDQQQEGILCVYVCVVYWRIM